LKTFTPRSQAVCRTDEGNTNDFLTEPRAIIKIRDENNNPLWYTHPIRKRGSDVVAVPLPMAGNDPIVNMYPINILKSEADLAVRIGMDVFILGYPFGSPPPGFPVWKRGSIASEPDLTRIGTGYMLVDTASRPGMSGAPVISARAGAAPIWWSPRRRLTLRARLPSDISTLHKSRHLYFVATNRCWRKADFRPNLRVAEGQQEIIHRNTTTSSP
jgi:hypothetical protein